MLMRRLGSLLMAKSHYFACAGVQLQRFRRRADPRQEAAEPRGAAASGGGGRELPGVRSTVLLNVQGMGVVGQDVKRNPPPCGVPLGLAAGVSVD